MATFRYLSCHPMVSSQLAWLQMIDPKWSQVVNGVGTFTGTIAVPNNTDRITQLKIATEPDQAALYVRNNDDRYVWGGLIAKQKWSRDERQVEITAVEWRSWFGGVFLGPQDDPPLDVLYSWTNKDQLLIAREIVGHALSGGATSGKPPFTVGAETSGINRDLHVKGTEFRTATALIDSMAQRDRGFDWDVAIDTDSTGLPSRRLGLYYPEKGNVVSGLVFADGKNILTREDIEVESDTRANRTWATGAGPTSESLPYASDADPALSSGFTVLREVVHNYHTVIERATLASHARAMREYLATRLNTLKIKVSLTDPPIDNYSVGDRGRLTIKDDWYDFSFPAVRVLERVVSPAEGGGVAEVTLDLTDVEAPEVDEGGAIS